MSMTTSVGVVGPSHWSYMAKTFERCLAEIVSRKRIEEDSVSNSIYLDAKEFFQLVSQAVQEGVPGNPPASANAYMIAARAIRSTVHPQTHETIRESLNEYLSFFNRIRDARDLSAKELETATSLQKFLKQLYLYGQSEAYESHVRFKERLASG